MSSVRKSASPRWWAARPQERDDLPHAQRLERLVAHAADVERGIWSTRLCQEERTSWTTPASAMTRRYPSVPALRSSGVSPPTASASQPNSGTWTCRCPRLPARACSGYSSSILSPPGGTPGVVQFVLVVRRQADCPVQGEGEAAGDLQAGQFLLHTEERPRLQAGHGPRLREPPLLAAGDEAGVPPVGVAAAALLA